MVVLEKTLESLLDFKIKPVNPKGNQPWIFVGRTNAEAEAVIFCTLWIEPGEGNGTTLQYSRLENPMDGGAW